MAAHVSCKVLVLLVGCLALYVTQAGCAEVSYTLEGQLRSRAASDLSCDAKQIEITETSTYRHYLAGGCGRVRYYTCLHGGCVHDD